MATSTTKVVTAQNIFSDPFNVSPAHKFNVAVAMNHCAGTVTLQKLFSDDATWYDVTTYTTTTAAAIEEPENGVAYRLGVKTGSMTSMPVSGFTQVDPGSGYTSRPTVGFSSGGGTGAAATAIVGLISLSVNAAGTVYTPGQSITLAGGTSSIPAVVQITTTKLISATVAAGGTGYGNAQTFTVTVAGGTQTTTSQLSVTSSAGGVVTTVNSVSQAGSYTVNPTLAANLATGGSGSGLTLNLVYGIETVTVTTAGDYTVFPTTFTQGSVSGGSGTGATFNSALAGVVSLTLTNGGSGYTSAPTIGFTGGAGTGASYTAVLTGDLAVRLSQNRLYAF